MSSLRRRPRSSAVKTPLEDDDLLAEILLRLPPQPSSLPRASLVCKSWHSLASDPGFARRFRIHHRRKPPLLGFFEWHFDSFVPTLEAPNRVPPARFSLQSQHGDRIWSLGCRHGLVLMFNLRQLSLLVWDPVTGDKHRIAIPSGLATRAETTVFDGAVLRTSGDTHFQVVLTMVDNNDKQHKQALACVYSSETGLWGDLISIPLLAKNSTVFPGKPAVLAGNSIYWILTGRFVRILEFDLEKQSLALIWVPVHILEHGQLWIVRAEGGGIGLLRLTGSILQLWKKTDCDGVASWTLGRTIELDKLLSLKTLRITILGISEENNVVFLWTCGFIFMIHLESLQFKKLFETYNFSHYHPFESVYTQGISGQHDAADLVHHT